MSSFTIARNDRLPLLEATLLGADGVAADLTGASGVTFSMRPIDGGALKVDSQAATIVSAASGQVSYAWANGDTDTAGAFVGEFEVTFTGRKQTFPNSADKIIISVIADLNAS